jgi:hypothetical protein
MHRRAAILALSGLAALLGGCASTGMAKPHAATVPSTPSTRAVVGGGVTAAPPTTAPVRAVRLTEAANGATIHVSKDNTVAVVLNSTYWTFTTQTTTVLQPIGSESVAPAPTGTCARGAGCGTASATYKAITAGQASVTAFRTICGEDLRCTGHNGAYHVQIVVAP